MHADEPGGHGFQLKQTLAGQEQRERGDVRAGMGQWKQLVLEQPAGGPCKEVESSLQSLVSSKQWGGFCKALYFIQSLQLLMRLVREASYSWVPAQCFEHRRHSRNRGINPSSFSKGKIKALKMPAFPGHHSPKGKGGLPAGTKRSRFYSLLANQTLQKDNGVLSWHSYTSLSWQSELQDSLD